MSDPLDRLDQAVEQFSIEHEALTVQTTWERANRFGLLWVHAMIGIAGGILILAAGTASALAMYSGMQLVTGILPLSGGLSLASGLAPQFVHKERSVPREVTGLFLLALWDVTMIAGFAVVAATIGGPLYPIAIYGGLFILLCVHLWTLRKMREAEPWRR